MTSFSVERPICDARLREERAIDIQHADTGCLESLIFDDHFNVVNTLIDKKQPPIFSFAQKLEHKGMIRLDMF